MIPTGFSLCERHSSEFSRPYHQSVLQKAGGFEVTQESGDGLIDLLRNPCEFLVDIRMVVPVVAGTTRSAPQLDKSHVALEHAPGNEASLTEVASDFPVHAIMLFDPVTLLIEIKHFRGCQLQPSRPFVGLNARLGDGVFGIHRPQPAKQGSSFRFTLLGNVRDMAWGMKKSDGILST